MTIDLLLEDKEVAQSPVKIKSVIQDMLEFTKQLIVDTEQSYKKMTSLYAQARDWKKSLEAKRKALIEPLRKEMAQINDRAKEFSDPLDQVISLANLKVNGYHALLEQKKAKEEALLREAASLFDASDEVYVPPVEKVLRGDGAVAVTKIEKEFRVLDISKVPLKYLMIDEKAVKQDLKLGISEIPGLEVYEETTTTLRIR